MLTHPLSVANATASPLLNRAIDNFQWGPPSGQNVGPHKAPPFKANCTIWFFDKFILFTKKAGHKELGRTTGFANAYGPKTTAYPNGLGHMKCKNPAKCLQPASAFCLARAKGLWWTMPAFRIVVSIKAASAQLVDLYVNACVRWWLFNTVNAFGLKDVGFITFLKPISVMAVKNWVPAPFSKMSTNALWTLSNTLILLESASGFESKCFYTWSTQQISSRNSDVPFASILCCLTTHGFSFVKGLIFQSEPYRMTRLMQMLQLFVRCELSTFKGYIFLLNDKSIQIIPRMGSKKVGRWRHRAELVNQGASLVFVDAFVLHSWMTARCTMLSSGGLPSNREIAHVCAWYASSFPAWKRTCHDLPWLTECSLQGGARLKHQNQYFEVCCGILILSATGKKWFRCLFWIACCT